MIVLHVIDTGQNHVDVFYFIIHAHMESSSPRNLVCSGMLHPGMPQFQSKVFQGEACLLGEPDSGLTMPDSMFMCDEYPHVYHMQNYCNIQKTICMWKFF